MSDHTPPIPPQVEQGKQQSNTLAVVSLVLAILSWFCLWVFGSVPAVIIGHMALRRKKGDGLAIAGLVVGYSNIVVTFLAIPLLAAILLPAFTRGHEAARGSACMNNLKQMSIVYKMFANESEGAVYPELSPNPGQLMFREDAGSGEFPVYPEYLTDLRILCCPSAMSTTPAVDDHDYIYLGYLVLDEEQLAVFVEAYKNHIAEGKEFDSGLPVPGDSDGGVIPRLSNNLEQYYSLSEIPVMWDRVDYHAQSRIAGFNHDEIGCNVLYMDGHVEWVPLDSKFPITERAADLLMQLDSLQYSLMQFGPE